MIRMMAMTDTPDAQPPHAPPITVLEVQGEERIPHRCFTPDVLREIDASLREGPFDKVEWEITDQQGVHTSTDLDALLKNLLWPSVENFELSCSRHFDEPDQRVRFPASVPSSYVRVTTHYSRMVVRWSSAPQNRQPVEFTFLRLLDLLRRLPASRASNPAFVESLPVEPLPVEAPPVESLPVASLPEEPTKAWWNLLRAPRSILDWVGIGLLVAAVVALAGAAVALLARTL
jgi:hypothetical protein